MKILCSKYERDWVQVVAKMGTKNNKQCQGRFKTLKEQSEPYPFGTSQTDLKSIAHKWDENTMEVLQGPWQYLSGLLDSYQKDRVQIAPLMFCNALDIVFCS